MTPARMTWAQWAKSLVLVSEPQVAGIQLVLQPGADLESVREKAAKVCLEELEDISGITDRVVSGQLRPF